MRVRDLIARMPEQFLDVDAAALVMIAAAEQGPMILSSCNGESAKQLLDMVASDNADWSNVTQIKPH